MGGHATKNTITRVLTWMGSKYARERSNKLFPTPLAPLTNTMSPALTVKLRLVMMVRSPTFRCSPMTSRMVSEGASVMLFSCSVSTQRLYRLTWLK